VQDFCLGGLSAQLWGRRSATLIISITYLHHARMNILKIYKIQQHGKSRQYRHSVEWVLEITSDPHCKYGGSLGSLPWKNKRK